MKLHKSNKTLIASIATMSFVMVGGAVGFAALSDILTPASAEAATSVILGQSGYNLSVASSSEVSMDLSGSFLMSKSTLNTKTNANGFSLYMGMQDNTNSLYLNGDSSSTALPSVSNTYSYTSPGTIANNTWGYAIPQSGNTNLASGNGFNTGTYTDNSTSESDTKWASVPVKGKDQIVQSTTTANNTTGVDLNVFYGVKANASQAAGAYKGTIVYTAVAKSSDANIASVSPGYTEKMNGGDTITLTIGINTTYASLTTKNITIGEDTCTVSGGGNNPDGTLYLTCITPKQKQSGFYDINIDLGSYGTYTIADGIEYIYNVPPKFFTTEYMQDFDATVCSSVKRPTADIIGLSATDGSDYEDNGTTATIVPNTTAKDKRDNQVYTIRKLADGNCWMAENLRFQTALSSSNVATYSANSDNWTDSNMQKMTSTYISSASGCGSYFANNITSKTTPSICTYQNDTVDTESNSKYGVLYNFCAASGGKVCSTTASMDSISGAIVNNKVAGSICPSNWTMPQMNNSPSAATSSAITTGFDINNQTSYSMHNLFNVYGIDNASSEYLKVVASPLNFPRAGRTYSGSLYNRGSYGLYWSSTPYTGSSVYGYYLSFNSSGVYQDYNDRYRGQPVRCVLSASS